MSSASVGGDHSARRRSSSVSSTRRSRRPSTASSVIRSPSRTSASGPPTADSGATCSATVPAAVPLMRASVMRTMSVTPSRQELRRDRDVATLRHARPPERADASEDEHAVARHREVRVVDAAVEIVLTVEHERGPVCCHSSRRRRRALEHRAAWRAQPSSTAIPPSGATGRRADGSRRRLRAVTKPGDRPTVRRARSSVSRSRSPSSSFMTAGTPPATAKSSIR